MIKALKLKLGEDYMVPSRYILALIKALRPEGSSQHMTPLNENSTEPVLSDTVVTFLVAIGVSRLTLLVSGKVWRTFTVDGEGICIALNLVNWNHWVAWTGPLPVEEDPDGESLARNIAAYRRARDKASETAAETLRRARETCV